jgi:carbon monoxide dehydrogenase subunit G
MPGAPSPLRAREYRVEISGEHRFFAPREVVWERLLDPDAIRASIPGCERFDVVAPDSYDVTMRVGIGALKGSYSGHVDVSRRPEAYAFHIAAVGSGQKGKLQGDAQFELRDGPGDDETVVRYTGDLRAQGGVARAGLLVLDGASKLLIGQFFKAMERQVAAHI